MQRLSAVNKHFAGQNTAQVTIDGKTYPEIIDNQPDREIKINYWNVQGWGYTDSGFEYDKNRQQIQIKGSRYMFGG